MKGLDWFRVMTDIAWDGDLEHVSDAAFRTFFELVAMSAYHLTDGVVPLSTARKHLNTRRVNDALEALSKQGCITLDADKVTINNYEKYQQTRAEVQAERDRNRARVRRYRAVTNGEVTEQSKSKSKSKKDIHEKEAVPRKDAGVLTAHYLDSAKKHGLIVTDADKGQLARNAKAALDQGASFDLVKAGIDKMVDKRLSPRLLGQLINEVKPTIPTAPQTTSDYPVVQVPDTWQR